jgi:hypothetical protein
MYTAGFYELSTSSCAADRIGHHATPPSALTVMYADAAGIQKWDVPMSEGDRIDNNAASRSALMAR